MCHDSPATEITSRGHNHGSDGWKEIIWFFQIFLVLIG